MPKPDYDTTLARIAGNIAAGLVGAYLHTAPTARPTEETMARSVVSLARAIVDEVKRTAPVSPTDDWVAKSQIKGGSAIAEKIDNLGNTSKNEQAPSRSIDG